jgi:hypothetical protein
MTCSEPTHTLVSAAYLSSSNGCIAIMMNLKEPAWWPGAAHHPPARGQNLAEAKLNKGATFYFILSKMERETNES